MQAQNKPSNIPPLMPSNNLWSERKGLLSLHPQKQKPSLLAVLSVWISCLPAVYGNIFMNGIHVTRNGFKLMNSTLHATRTKWCSVSCKKNHVFFVFLPFALLLLLLWPLVGLKHRLELTNQRKIVCFHRWCGSSDLFPVGQ